MANKLRIGKTENFATPRCEDQDTIWLDLHNVNGNVFVYAFNAQMALTSILLLKPDMPISIDLSISCNPAIVEQVNLMGRDAHLYPGVIRIDGNDGIAGLRDEVVEESGNMGLSNLRNETQYFRQELEALTSDQIYDALTSAMNTADGTLPRPRRETA